MLSVTVYLLHTYRRLALQWIMDTSFSATYATIFMIWLETPIIEEFRTQILLYKRFLDNIFMIWSGSSAA